MAKVFVSYAREDAQKVHRILSKLERQGIEFWIDTRDIENGRDWNEEISKAIVRCSKFLLFMSTAAMKSNNIKKEVEIAFEHGKKTIILRLDASKLADKFKYPLAGIQWTNYSEPDWAAEVVSAIRGRRTVFQEPKPKPSPAALPVQSSPPKPPSRPVRSPSPKPLKPQQVIAELEGIFSANREYYKDECTAALVKLDHLHIVIGSHWINPALAYNELVPRVYLLEKIEHIKSLLQDFQATCHPGSPTKRQLIHDELKALGQELNSKASK